MPRSEHSPLSKRETQPMPEIPKQSGGETPATKQERGVHRRRRAPAEIATQPLEGVARESPVERAARERNRIVAETRVLSEALGDLLKIFAPECHAREEAIRAEEATLHGKIVYDELWKTHRENGSSPVPTTQPYTQEKSAQLTEKIEGYSNELWFMRMGDREMMPAIVKPARGEAQYRRGIHPGEAYAREWLTFMIDRALALGVVPTTVVRRTEQLKVRAGDNDLCSAQRYVEEEYKFAYEAKDETARGAYDGGRSRVAVLDYFTQNTDRHAQNELFLSDGGVVAIDHGLTFEYHPDAPEQYYSKPMEHLRGRHIPVNLKEGVQRLLRSKPLLDILERSFTVAFGARVKEAKWHWDGFMQRLTTLSARENFFEDYTVPGEFVITEKEKETQLSTTDITDKETTA